MGKIIPKLVMHIPHHFVRLPNNNDNRKAPIMQTAIIVTLEDGSEVLVTIQGIHIVNDDYSIQAATRRDSFSSWGIPLPIEVRNEG